MFIGLSLVQSRLQVIFTGRFISQMCSYSKWSKNFVMGLNRRGRGEIFTEEKLM